MLHNRLNVGHVLQVNKRPGELKSYFSSQNIRNKIFFPKISHDLTRKGSNRLNQSKVEKPDCSIKTI